MKKNTSSQARIPWLACPCLIAPAMAALLLFFVLPALVTAGVSFTDWTLGSPDFSWAGWDNYRQIFADPDFQKSLGNTFKLTLMVVPSSFILSLGLALAIRCLGGRWAELWQTVYFLPVTTSLVAMSVVWQWVLHPEVGIVAWLLSCFGVLEKINWLNDGDIVLFTLAFITVWQMIGYYMVIFLTGLMRIPTDVYEAAQVDGADRAWSRFWHITWPLLTPTSFFVFILTVIKTFQVFDIVKVLTRGGPEKASEILLYTMYQEGFSFFRTNIAASIATLYLLVMLALTLWQNHVLGRRVHYGV